LADIDTASITYHANGGTGTGFVARPADGAPHPGVVVIQEWWGLDAHIKDIAQRFAREGFVAIAPDLYHGQVAAEPDAARKLVMNLNREQAMKECLGAVAWLRSREDVVPSRVGCIGFCMGGSLTLALAAATPEVAAAAPFYAGMQPGRDQLGKIEAEMFCAFGADDAGIPLENVRAFEESLRATGRNAVVRVYDGAPHSFFNDTKPSYRADAAADAWSQSLALFRRVLVP
jgi:carboxymethylenebutenolidase